MRYRFVNAAAERLYQRSSAEVLGRGLIELFPTVVDLGIFACYVEPLRTGRPCGMRVPSFDDNGVAGAFDIAATPFGDGVVVTAHDVTGHVAAEHALEESEARYRLLVENTADVIIHSVDGLVRFVSPSVERVFGWTVEDLVGRSTVHLWHPDDVARAVAMRDAVYAGEPGRGVLRFRMKSGSYAWIEATLRPIDAASGGGMVASFRDVSAQVEAEEGLRRSEEQFHRLAENATDVVYLSGRDRKVKWIAPTVTRALGWTPEELVGTSIGDLMHPDDLRATAQVRSTAYAGRDPGEPEGGYYVRLRTKGGRYRWMAGHLTVVPAADGTHGGVVVGLKDVDELVQARDTADADRARMRATMDSLLDPHVLFEAVRDESNAIVDFTYVDANPAAAKDLGWDLEDVPGTLFTRMSPGAAAAGMLDLLVAAVDSGRPLVLDNFTYPNPRDPSQTLNYDVRAVRMADGLSVTWRDVTERQRSIDAVAASEEQYRLLAENSTDVVIRIRDGIVLWTSPSVTEALGWTQQEVQGHPVSEFVHPEDTDRTESDQAEVDTGRSSARISSPRTRSLTIGRRRTATVSCPEAAASPIRAGVMTLPAGIRISPARASSPLRRKSPPARTRPRTILEPSRSPSSLRSTPSQPRGRDLPVAICTACPTASRVAQTAPASTWPMTTHGPSPATAQPSIAETSVGGSGVSARTSSAAVRPWASRRRTGSVGSWSTHACAIRRASCQLGSTCGISRPSPNRASEHGCRRRAGRGRGTRRRAGTGSRTGR